jgi:hypothetical protein
MCSPGLSSFGRAGSRFVNPTLLQPGWEEIVTKTTPLFKKFHVTNSMFAA